MAKPAASFALPIAAGTLLLCAAITIAFLFHLHQVQRTQNEALGEQVMELSTQIEQLETRLSQQQPSDQPAADRVLVSGHGFALHGSGRCLSTYTTREQARPDGAMTDLYIGSARVGQVLMTKEGDVSAEFRLMGHADQGDLYASFDRAALGSYESPGCSLSVVAN